MTFDALEVFLVCARTEHFGTAAAGVDASRSAGIAPPGRAVPAPCRGGPQAGGGRGGEHPYAGRNGAGPRSASFRSPAVPTFSAMLHQHLTGAQTSRTASATAWGGRSMPCVGPLLIGQSYLSTGYAAVFLFIGACCLMITVSVLPLVRGRRGRWVPEAPDQGPVRPSAGVAPRETG